MKDIPYEKVFETVWPTISTWGSKFFVALVGIVVIIVASYLKLPHIEWIVSGVTVICVAYFAFRRQQEKGVGQAQDKARAEIMAKVENKIDTI